MAGLIEISYPIFIVLFTWLLFRDAPLDLDLRPRGPLIMAGAAGRHPGGQPSRG